MAKKLNRIELNIVCEPDEQGVWQASVSADLVVGLSEPEYADMEPRRKGIAVTLTAQQENTILNFIRNVVVPQADLAKDLTPQQENTIKNVIQNVVLTQAEAGK